VVQGAIARRRHTRETRYTEIGLRKRFQTGRSPTRPPRFLFSGHPTRNRLLSMQDGFVEGRCVRGFRDAMGISFSDIPESTDKELNRARRVGRPKSGNAKQLIAIRISPQLLAQLRRLAAKRDKPYQTLIHKLLERAARESKVA